MLMLQDRDTQLCENFPDRKSSHFFNSFFIERLLVTDKKYNYNNIHRWSKKFDIFTKHKIFFPINLNNAHWTLAVVYMDEKRIHYYDSKCGAGMQQLEGLKKWIADEARSKKKMELDMTEWVLISEEAAVPQQTNGVDCGVFTIVCADFISDVLRLSYSQKDMSTFREKIGTDIIRGKLTYDIKSVRK